MGNNIENLRELPDIQNPLLLFKNLKTDLDKLKSQIDNLKNIELTSKLLHGISLKKSDIPDVRSLEYTASRLSHNLKNTNATELSDRLHKYPEDSKSRLKLVEMFLQETESCSLPISRDAFLLAMQEVASPMISTQKINMALAAQTIYLEKLQKVLKDDLTETESKIKGDGNVDTILEKQLKRM